MSNLNDTPNAIEKLTEQIAEVSRQNEKNIKLTTFFTFVIAITAVAEMILKICGV